MTEDTNNDVILDYERASDTFNLYCNPSDDEVIGNLSFRKGLILDLGKNGAVLGLSVDQASKNLQMSPDEISNKCDNEEVGLLFERAMAGIIDIDTMPTDKKRNQFYAVKIVK